MEVVVRLHPDAAFAFHPKDRADGDPTRRGAIEPTRDSAVEAVLGRFGVTLVPVHPGIADPGLATWFVVPDAPAGRAEEIAAALRGLAAVEAAYVQPPVAPA